MGPHSIGPIFGQGQATPAIHFELGAPGVVRAHLEYGGEDQTVHLALDAVHDDTLRGDTLDVFPVGVDQLTFGPLKVGRYSSLKVGRLHIGRTRV